MFDRLAYLFSRKISLKFMVTTALITLCIFIVVFAWFSAQQERHIMDQVRKQAIILHKQLVVTRRWLADQKTVLVPKGGENETNPFLLNPDVKGSDGKLYTKTSPSIVTRLLSERAAREGLFSFKLTNTVLLNPENAPDEFERRAIRTFRGSEANGIFNKEIIDGRPVLRYAAPVIAQESCLACHMAQGYRPGDIAGCLSVFIPIDEAHEAINHNKWILFLGIMGLCGSLVTAVFVAGRHMVFKRIGELESSVDEIGRDDTTPARRPHEDELENISHVFEHMTERLKNQHLELEKKISEATKELSQTNANLERANRELEELNRSKLEFFSDISHELRTPLTSIKGAVNLLERKLSCEDPTYVNIIRRNTDHLIKKVLDFLDYSKIEAGRLELDKTRGRVADVARDAILSHQPQAEAKGVHIELRENEETAISFDHERIYQVFGNLLSNAIRFAPEGSTIRVDVNGTGQVVRASVSDEGPGIPAEHHESIFHKFYQVEGSDSAEIHRGSAGIGLAVCKGLIRIHGGEIWVESQAGQGSCFVFTIPAEV